MSKDVLNYLNYLLESLYNASQQGFLKFEEMYNYQDEIGSKLYELATIKQNRS